jgi:hypothetical protein
MSAKETRKLAVVEDETLGNATPDGGFYITKEQLERIVPGDAKLARKRLRLMIADEREPRRIYGPTKKPASVRIATPRDEQAVYDLMLMAHRENGQQFAPLSPKKVEAQIQAATQLRGNVLGVIDGLDGPVAMALLSPCQWWWAESHYFGDLVQYVHPSHRKSQHADDLLTFERWCADDMARGTGYPVYLVAGVLSLYRTRAKERLWRRHLNSVGSLFIYPWPLPEQANGQ